MNKYFFDLQGTFINVNEIDFVNLSNNGSSITIHLKSGTSFLYAVSDVMDFFDWLLNRKIIYR